MISHYFVSLVTKQWPMELHCDTLYYVGVQVCLMKGSLPHFS